MRLILLLWTALILFPLAAQEGEVVGNDSEGTEAEKTDEEKTDEEKAEELIVSLNEEKRDVLLYGIDTEVQDVIATIRSEKDMTFNSELAELINQNDNPNIIRSVLDFFGEMEIDLAEERSLELLRNHLEDYEYTSNLLLSSISYLGSIESESAGTIFYDLLTDNNKAIASSALRGIGRLKDDSRVDEIMSLLEEYSGDSEYEDFSASAILVLGELSYLDAQTLLEDILQDEDAPSVQRQYAAVAIGQFNQAEGLTLLRSMYTNSTDSLLRSYVLKGITEYDDPEVETLLISALRDSFWRIRVAAAEGLGEREVRDAVSILEYKVKKDPVRHVRYASLASLAEISGSRADEFVLSQFEGERVAFDIRLKALELMLEKQISGSVKALENVLNPKWDKDKDNELGPICKALSTSEWNSLKPFFARMLAHNDFVIRIYGIRGVKLNRISSLKEAVRALDDEKQPVNVRREAKAALESF